MLEPESNSQQPHPCERQPGENPQAFADFQDFLEQGVTRSYVATSRRRRRSYSLIRRYAKRFEWRERARAWDNVHNRDEEEERRAARREFLRRQEEEAWKLWRLGLALVHRFVKRDAATGEWIIDPKLAPKDVLALLKFVSDLLAQIRQTGAADEDRTRLLEISWGAPEAGGSDQNSLPIRHPGLRRLLGLTEPEDDQRSRAQGE